VITDIVMPVMDGVALVRAMKQSYPHIPVIACSGWGQEGLQAQLKELGVKTFLEKPYEAEKVLAALHEHLTAAS
jgi:CheY-like chemotaxis protein